MSESTTHLSLSAVARRLGVSESRVWRMIADGYLDATSELRGGRLYTQVEVPQRWPDDPPGVPARSRTMRLQEEITALRGEVTRLERSLECERAETSRLRSRLLDAARTAPAQPAPPTAAFVPAHISDDGIDAHDESYPSEHEPEPVYTRTSAYSWSLSINTIPQGITSRPNPMTAPAEMLPSMALTSREAALDPLRGLFSSQADSRRFPWRRR